MGGVYRIQTFFGFLYFFYIYKAPKSSESDDNLTIFSLDPTRLKTKHC